MSGLLACGGFVFVFSYPSASYVGRSLLINYVLELRWKVAENANLATFALRVLKETRTYKEAKTMARPAFR